MTPHAPSSVDTIKAALEVFAGMLQATRINPEPCAAAVADPLLLATDLADYLVKRGTPFRQAHEIVGRTVALSIARKVPLSRLSLEEFQSISPTYGSDLFTVFDLEKAMSARTGIGSPSPQNVAGQISRWQAALG